LSFEGCSDPLGLEDGRIGDSQMRASSSYSYESVGPSAGRLNSEKGGGAWCPKNLISENMETQEFLEIDLEYNHIISAVVTQGRFSNGRGAEFAEFYIVQFWRQGMDAFVDYTDDDGEKILEANKNTFSESKIILESTIVASKIRIIPYSQHPRTVCMRVELLGCLEEEIQKENTIEAIEKIIEEENMKDDSFEEKEVDVYLGTNESTETTENVFNDLVVVDGGWGPHYLGAVVGLLLTVILILIILIVIILKRTLRNKQFSSNSNISFTSSLARKSEIYKQDLENGPIYQEPFLIKQEASPYNHSILDSSLDSFPAPCLPTSNYKYSTGNKQQIYNVGHIDQIYSVPLFTSNSFGKQVSQNCVNTLPNIQTTLIGDQFKMNSY